MDASGTSARGVLTDDQGRAVEAGAVIAPLDPAGGTLTCLGRIAAASRTTLPELLKGTETIVIRTGLARELVATRSGARIGTIATKGFRTRLVFQPVKCSHAADQSSVLGGSVSVLADGHLMTEVTERVDAQGTVVAPLDEESVVTAVRYLKKQQVEAIAVLLLFSPLHPQHELRVGEIIADEFPGAHVAVSSAVLPSLGEFKRWSTTLFSAYVAPKVSSYVAGLSRTLSENGFGGELLFAGPEGEAATAEAVVDNPALLLHPNASVAAEDTALSGVPQGFRDLLAVDTGAARYRVGFHPGQAARKGCDGSPGISFAVATADSFWTDVEHGETHCPVVVDELLLLEDGEGAGEYRGAPGVCVEVTLQAAVELTSYSGDDELLLCAPEGVCRPLRAKGRQQVLPGERCVARCKGSDGWGNPLDRAVTQVQQDAIAGYVSVKRAREVYGVALNPTTLELLCDATLKLREQRRAKARKRAHSQIARQASGH
ncbi:MAG: hydantoinase/oxoprolinase N-terminal domain-containing protein [Deferrisomatales bacterium]|nr:hydantoinase/oxoprolinase N-terminal domain-containing protein [Deferrisomatales bacterium]